LNKQEGVFRAYRDCPQLKDFTDEQIRAIAEDAIEMPEDGEDALDEENDDDIEENLQKSRKGLG